MRSDPGRDHRKARRAAAGALALAVACAGVLVGGAAPAQADPQDVTAGSADWGVRAAFRTYVTSTIGGPAGTITVTGGASTNPGGTFHFVDGTGDADMDAGTLEAGFDGTVQFLKHGGALDMTISDIHVTKTGTTGAIVADVVSRNSDGDLISYPDTAFGTLDYTSIAPTVVGDDVTFSAVPAVLTADGSSAFAGFYAAGTALDPITFTLTLEDPPPTWTPAIAVSKATNVDPAGETVTVTGSGFDPNANITRVGPPRPPVPAGFPTGIYVVFGRFADTWQPSLGAPSSVRKVIDQKWPLPAASKAAAEAAFGPNAQYVVLQADGSFTTTLHLSPNETYTGNYGIYTYAAGGAVPNASQETFTPISFIAPTGTDASASVKPFNLRGTYDSTKFTVNVNNVDTNDITVSAADIDVTVEVNGVEVADPVTALTTTTKKVKATKVGMFAYEWTHGASLQAGDVVEVTACVTVPNDDWPSNNCGTTTSPSGTVDLASSVKAAPITTKKTSTLITSSVLNNGTAKVLLRPENVDLEIFVNDVPAGGTVTSKTELGKRGYSSPTKTKSYNFTWDYGTVSVGDVVRIVSCVPVPGDLTPADNCTEQSYTVVK